MGLMMSDNIHTESGITNDWRNMLYTETRRIGGDPSFLFEILEGIIEDRAWEILLDDDGNPVGSLQRLIEEPLPVGIGMSVSRIRQLLQIEHRHEGKSEAWKSRMRQLRIAIDNELKDVDDSDSNHLKIQSQLEQYKLNRLKNEAPDLAKKVLKKKLSISEAYEQAKLSRKRSTVNMENAKSAFDTLTKNMNPEALDELIDLLNEYRDYQ